MLHHAFKSIFLVMIVAVEFSFSTDDFQPIFPKDYVQSWKPTGRDYSQNSRSFNLDQNEPGVIVATPGSGFDSQFMPVTRSHPILARRSYEDVKKSVEQYSNLNKTRRNVKSTVQRVLSIPKEVDHKGNETSRSIASELDGVVELIQEAMEIQQDLNEFEARGKIGKKYRRYLLPLLLAYKLKFFALLPLMMGGLVLLASSTGLAGFFFALFAATMGLKAGGH